MSNIFKPSGVEWEESTGRKLILVTNGVNAGWICYQHPDGHWVTLKKPSEKERLEIIDHFNVLRHG